MNKRNEQPDGPLFWVTVAVGMMLIWASVARAQTPDTVRAEMVLPIPVQISTLGDTTVVDVRVDVHTDSLAVLAERVWLARQAEIAMHGHLGRGHDRPSYKWEIRLGLLVAAGAVLAWAFKAEEETILNVHQSQTQDQSQTTRTSVTRFPWCWPPGHCKRKWGKHGGEEDE